MLKILWIWLEVIVKGCQCFSIAINVYKACTIGSEVDGLYFEFLEMQG